jgi:hypothetical protein
MKTSKPVEVTIYFDLSEQGQREEIKQGRTGQREQSIDGKIQPEDVDLFKVDPQGVLSVEGRGNNNSMPTSIDELVTWVRKAKEDLEIEEQKRFERPRRKLDVKSED